MTPSDGSTLLEVRGLQVAFGGLLAVKGLDLTIATDAIHALIGPNGAGKSTVVNALSGFVRPTAGSVMLCGRSIFGQPAHRVAAAGIARTFQNICLFGGMTVMENVLVGAHRHFRASFLDLVLHRRSAVREEQDAQDRARAALAFVGLAGQEAVIATTLAYGHQRRLEIARALLLDPALLLLDEPMAGMNAAEKDELAELIRSIRARGTAILLIEHDMQVIRSLADRVAVLHHGERLADDTVDIVFADAAVQQAYLGNVA